MDVDLEEAGFVDGAVEEGEQALLYRSLVVLARERNSRD